MIRKLNTFLQMIKIEHSVFALPFAYLGLFLAEEGLPSFGLFMLITVAMVSFRTMSMGLNRIIDRHIDKANPRTENRALPKNELKVSFVWFATLSFGGLFLWTAYLLGELCFRLAFIPIALSFLYPFAKRFTWLCHVLLGFILGIAPYGAWIASRGEFSWTPGWIMIGVVCWVTGFDIIYALQDEAFDKKAGLFSIPAAFGAKSSLKLTLFLHVLTIAAWALAGLKADLGVIYFLGLVLVAAVLVREYWLVKSFGLAKIQQAFFSMNMWVSFLLFSAAIADIGWRSMA